MYGLNSSGGENRIKYRKLRQRIDEVDIDVVHRVRQSGYLDPALAAAPSMGSRGCYFQDELERCNELESSTSFKRFYHDLKPLVQSLPEVLHHLPTIVEKLSQEMRHP